MTHLPTQLTALLKELISESQTAGWMTVNREALTWTVGFDDDSVVLLEWDEDQARLIALTLLGRPPENAVVTVYRTALGFNGLWRENAGARIVMVDTEGELALTFELPVQELTLERLRLVLESVRSAGRTWIRFVADPADAHDGPPPASSLNLQRV